GHAGHGSQRLHAAAGAGVRRPARALSRRRTVAIDARAATPRPGVAAAHRPSAGGTGAPRGARSTHKTAMTTAQTVDGVLVQWGERLFYPSNRIVKAQPTPRLDTLTRRKAAVIRGRIVATVVRRAPQVMVKVTGGGRG